MADGRKTKGKHPEKALTPTFVRKTTKPGRYYDGNGLFLKVDPSGAKRWGQRLVIRGRQRTLGLGGCMLVSLAEAREVALENRKIARAGGDPLERRRKTDPPSFEAAAATVIELHRAGWRNEKHAAQWGASPARLCLPAPRPALCRRHHDGRRDGRSHANLERETGDRATRATAHFDGHEMGRGGRPPER